MLRCIFGPNLVLIYRADKLTSPKWDKFWFLSSIWHWRSRSMYPKNNRDLKQGVLHLWSRFGDYSFHGWQVIYRTNLWLTDTHTHIHTHRQTQAMAIPEGHNWPWVKIDDSVKYPVCGASLKGENTLHNLRKQHNLNGDVLNTEYGKVKHSIKKQPRGAKLRTVQCVSCKTKLK